MMMVVSALILVLAATGYASALDIVAVSAPDINCKFVAGSPPCTVVVNDSSATIPLVGAGGTNFLQTRTFEGEAGSATAGLTAYLYRIDLTNVTGSACIDSFDIGFGPVVSVDYNNDTVLDHIFVVTSGGLGGVGPTSAEQIGDRVFFTFATPVCAGETSYFFGLVSGSGPVTLDAHVEQSVPSPATSLIVAARAPSNAASLAECITDSDEVAGTFISSAPCGTYGEMITRYESGGTPVTVKYMVHHPAGDARAVVVLFAGGIGETGITGDPATGIVSNANNNFLVRSAQLFAELGYSAITIDRPSYLAGVTTLHYDHYRISPKHAEDIVAVVSQVNGQNLDVFLAGTSRGSLSVVAQDALGIGSMLSSPVTFSGGALFIGCTDPVDCPRLQPGFVTVPVHVLAHEQDGCFASPFANSKKLHKDFLAAGVDSKFNGVTGGFDLTGGSIDACDAKTHHGYLGIENTAVGAITTRMNKILKNIHLAFPGNSRPVAGPGSLSTAAPTPVSIDLATLASDPDGDLLSYSLPHNTSTQGAGLSIVGSVVTYTPSAAGITDGFVYVVSDGKGGTSAAVVTVAVF